MGIQYHVAFISISHGTGIPLREVEALARILQPQIQVFEREEGQMEFTKWKEKRHAEQH